MEESRSNRRGLLTAIVLVPLAAAALLWLPRWWENREYREVEAIAGVGARVGTGTLGEARAKAETGMKASSLEAAIGKPSMAVATEGKESRREIWTYYYADGTMIVNITDGLVQRVSATFQLPVIPTSARP